MSSSSDLTVALKITGDAKAAVAALEDTRKAQLNAFGAGREAADKAAIQWKLAEAEVKRLAQAARESGSGHEQHAAALSAAAAQAAQSKTAWVAGTQALAQRRAELIANAGALDQARQAEARATAEAARRTQAAKLASARDALGVTPFRDIAREIALGEAAYKRLAASGKLSMAELAQAKMKLVERTQALQAQTNGWAEALGKVRGSALALAAVGASLAGAVSQAAAFELAMAQAKKYIDFPDENGFTKLRAELLAMTREIPLTAIELSKIAAAAGQAGVAANEIGEYVRMVSKIAVAFDMLPEEAAAAFGKLRTVFKLSVNQTRDLGDTVNWLGDKMANVAERDIVNVMVRAGGMAKMMNLSAKETAALASAFLTLGTPPEVAANAINAFLTKLSTLNGAEPKVQEAFTRYIGSIDEFSARMMASPAAAIDHFLSKVNALPDSVRPIALSHILGLEYADDIAKLASGLDDYRTALKLAADAGAQGGIDAQFAEQMKTASQQFDLLKNAAAETAIIFGNQLLPGLIQIAGAVRDVTVNVGQLIDAIPGSATAISVLITTLAGIGVARIGMAALGVVVARLTGGLGLAAAGAAGLARGALAVVARFVPWAVAIQAVLWGLDKLFGEDKAAKQEEATRKTEANAQAFAKLADAVRKAGGNYQAIEAAARQAAGADEQTQQKMLANAENYASEVLAKARQLASEKQRLAELTAQRQALLLGRETLSEEQSVDARIKAAQKLTQAKQQELQKALQEVERYNQAATAAYERAAGIRMSTADKVRELRRRDMSEEAQQADIAAQATEKLAAAEAKVAEARQRAGRGDTSGAEKAAQAAEALAKEAESLGTSLKNTGKAIGIVEQAGKVAAEAATTAGDANRKSAEGAKKSVAELQEELSRLATQLTELENQKRLIKIDADIAAAQANIQAIQGALDALRDKTVTVTVVQRTVEQHSVGGLVGAGVKRFAVGGHLPGYGGGDRIQALLEAGEFVMRKEAVRRYGLGAMMAINSMRAPLPAYAVGGIVGIPSAPAANHGGGREVLDINLRLPGSAEPVRVSAERGEAERLVQALNLIARAA
jgi:TP901 family phage tail tape measure protein